jgi:hypothetical protein
MTKTDAKATGRRAMDRGPNGILSTQCSAHCCTTSSLKPAKSAGHFQHSHEENGWIPLSITNKMQRYTIFFIAVGALRVSGGFSAHHQELKTVHTVSGMSGLLDATASGSIKQA